MQPMLEQMMKRTQTIFLSDNCKVEGHEKYQLMRLSNGTVLCPRCETERKNEAIEKKNEDLFERLENRLRHAYLKDKSILSDKPLWDAGFKNYVAEEEEEVENKRFMMNLVKKLQTGENFNIWLMGSPGVGKSFLSMAALKNLNEYGNKNKTCLFVSISAMLRKIRASYSDKNSRYTEDYFVNLMGEVDYLVLDDAGSENGAIGTNKAASDFTQRILYAVTDLRQDKTTIITTNLTWDELKTTYDSKLISRMSRKIKMVKFTNTSDKRLGI